MRHGLTRINRVAMTQLWRHLAQWQGGHDPANVLVWHNLRIVLRMFSYNMESPISIPEEVPVMTLPNLAFFPQALLPLHIFESRYRRMLEDALDKHRLFAVAGLDVNKMATGFEPAYRIATIGVVRACQGRDDGTWNLLLQGLTRVEFTENLGESPYRRMKIRVLASEPGAQPDENARLRSHLSRLLSTRLKLSGQESEELTKFLSGIDDPATFSDLAAYNLCGDPRLKQRLLETLNVNQRLLMLISWARREVDTMRLKKKLQGELPDEDIYRN
jgi:Lon protease-like protein